MPYTFSKSERLCSKNLIESLFSQGEKMLVFPYSIHYRLLPAEQLPRPAQALIATSKHKFRHAVDRNRVKRLTRECYRLRKNDLYCHLESRRLALIISFNYIHTDIFDYATISHKFDKIIRQLVEKIDCNPLLGESMIQSTTHCDKEHIDVVGQAKEGIR